MGEKVKCSVCGNLIDNLPYEICPVCGWERDLIQEEYPAEEGWANEMSLNQARADWDAKGKQTDIPRASRDDPSFPCARSPSK